MSNKVSGSLVSIIITAYNVEDYINAAIKSALQQTYADIELIVVNDCSTDNTGAIAKSYSSRAVKVIDHPENYGVSEAHNTGLRAAQGEFVAILDSDDVALRDRIERQVEFMQRNPRVGVVGGATTLFGNLPRDIKTKHIFSPSNHDHLYAQLLLNASFNNTTLMYRRVAMDSIYDSIANKYYVGGLRSAEDYNFYARLLSSGWKGASLPRPLVLQRKRLGSISIHPDNRKNSLKAQMRLLKLLGIHPSREQEELHGKIAFFNDYVFQPSEWDELLTAASRWFVLIRRANADKKVFSEQALRDVLFLRWILLVGMCEWRKWLLPRMIIKTPTVPSIRFGSYMLGKVRSRYAKKEPGHANIEGRWK